MVFIDTNLQTLFNFCKIPLYLEMFSNCHQQNQKDILSLSSSYPHLSKPINHYIDTLVISESQFAKLVNYRNYLLCEMKCLYNSSQKDQQQMVIIGVNIKQQAKTMIEQITKLKSQLFQVKLTLSQSQKQRDRLQTKMKIKDSLISKMCDEGEKIKNDHANYKQERSVLLKEIEEQKRDLCSDVVWKIVPQSKRKEEQLKLLSCNINQQSQIITQIKEKENQITKKTLSEKQETKQLLKKINESNDKMKKIKEKLKKQSHEKQLLQIKMKKIQRKTQQIKKMKFIASQQLEKSLRITYFNNQQQDNLTYQISINRKNIELTEKSLIDEERKQEASTEQIYLYQMDLQGLKKYAEELKKSSKKLEQILQCLRKSDVTLAQIFLQRLSPEQTNQNRNIEFGRVERPKLIQETINKQLMWTNKTKGLRTSFSNSSGKFNSPTFQQQFYPIQNKLSILSQHKSNHDWSPQYYKTMKKCNCNYLVNKIPSKAQRQWELTNKKRNYSIGKTKAKIDHRQLPYSLNENSSLKNYLFSNKMTPIKNEYYNHKERVNELQSRTRQS